MKKIDHYLDHASTAAKMPAAIQAESDFYREINANPLRGLYKKSVQASTGVEAARKRVLELVGAGDDYTVVFTRNATEALNLVANGLLLKDDGFGVIGADAKIVVDIESHHSNILPFSTRYQNVVIARELDSSDLQGVQVISLTGVSNVTGENFLERIREARMSHPEAILGVDGAQMVGHAILDLDGLGVDYMAFSGHKFGAPMGIGGLIVKKTLAERLRPLNFGGEMVNAVAIDGTPVYAEIPERLEAGTLSVGAIFGLEKAAAKLKGMLGEYLDGCVVYPSLMAFVEEKTKDAAARLKKIEGVEVLAANGSILTFNVTGVHPHDVAQILADEGVAVRAGWLCAEPYLRYRGWGPVVRASFNYTNREEDVDALISAVSKVCERMGKDVRC